MTYKVTMNGGERDAVRKSLEEQSDVSIKSKNMTEEHKSALLKIVDALPGTHLAGTIQDNNNGTVTINVTARTVAEARVASVAARNSGEAPNSQRKMESETANKGASSPNQVTAAGGAKPQGATPGATPQK